MYFLELLIKKIKKVKEKPQKIEINLNDDIMQQPEEPCNHMFMPIDNTGEILACKNCGMIINKNETVIKSKDFNFFMQSNKKD